MVEQSERDYQLVVELAEAIAKQAEQQEPNQELLQDLTQAFRMLLIINSEETLKLAQHFLDYFSSGEAAVNLETNGLLLGVFDRSNLVKDNSYYWENLLALLDALGNYSDIEALSVLAKNVQAQQYQEEVANGLDELTTNVEVVDAAKLQQILRSALEIVLTLIRVDLSIKVGLRHKLEVAVADQPDTYTVELKTVTNSGEPRGGSFLKELHVSDQAITLLEAVEFLEELFNSSNTKS